MAQAPLTPVPEPVPGVDISVVVTLYNEAGSLDELYRRTIATLDPLDRPYELIFVDDGSTDGTFAELERLLAAVESGYDVASGRRVARRDSWGRTLPSRLINGMLRRFTGVQISDFGCAFNAYRRDVVVPMLGAIGKQKFTKALVLSGGASVVEVDVDHAARAGSSRYSPLRL